MTRLWQVGTQVRNKTTDQEDGRVTVGVVVSKSVKEEGALVREMVGFLLPGYTIVFGALR